MITDKKIFAIKAKLLAEISHTYEKLIKAKQLSDKEADKIIEFVKSRLVHCHSSEDFTKAIEDFCTKFPGFNGLQTKIRATKTEEIQKLAQEHIEPLMDTNIEKWEELIELLEKTDENNLEDWLKKVPPKTKFPFMETLLEIKK